MFWCSQTINRNSDTNRVRLNKMRTEKNGGFSLAFYAKERKLFPEAYNTKVADVEAEKIVRKLLRHFGLPNTAKTIQVRFYGNRQSGSCGDSIRLSHAPSVGLICHEVGHKFNWKHDKKLMRWMKRLIAYCFRKNLWRSIE
jgi:hypothetical protein